MRSPWLVAATVMLVCRADGGRGPSKATLCVLIPTPHPTLQVLAAVLLSKASAGARRSAEIEGLKDDMVLLHRRLSFASSRCSDFGGPDGPPAPWRARPLSEPEAAPLPAAVHAQYRKHGHVVLRNFLDPADLEVYAALARDLVVDKRHDWDRAMGRPGADHDLGKKQFVRVYNLHETEPEMTAFAHSPRLAKAAHELSGMAGGIRHYQNQAFFKERADGPTLYHADNLACPLDTRNQYITAWIPIANVSTEMGLLTFASASHTDMSLNYWNSGQKQLEGKTKGPSDRGSEDFPLAQDS